MEQEAKNRVSLGSEANTCQVELVGWVEKGNFRGYIKVSAKSHASTHKGDDEYGDVEVRTLQTICALLAALESLFQRGPLLTILHSKLPTLLLGNAQEHISLNLPNTLPQMDSYFENVKNINKDYLDMKNKRMEEMHKA